MKGPNAPSSAEQMLEEAYRDKRVLITGGLGFIGSTLAYRLVAMGADVSLVDSLIPDYGGNLFNIHGLEERVKVNISDVRDSYSMNYLAQAADYLFNLAGTLSHADSMLDPFTDLEINCRSQLSILESCRHYNPGVRIVFAGTRGQYGRVDHLPVDETCPQRPIDVNGINNMAGEWYHILYNNVYELQATSLRLTNTYGPRHQMRHHRQGIINWFIRLLMDGQAIKIYGDGRQVRDVNYVDDVVDALLLAMVESTAAGEVYNVGGEAVSLVELVDRMIAVYGKGDYELVPYPDDVKHLEVGDYVANYSKLTRATGWSPKVGLEDGLARTFAFYERHREHYW